MQSEGPLLAEMLHRLIETPQAFLGAPKVAGSGEVDVAAVVWDLLRELGESPPPAALTPFRPTGRGAADKREQLRLTLLVCWLLAHPSLRQQGAFAHRARLFLEKEVPVLVEHLSAEKALADDDRREELVRRLLRALDLRPAGETPEQAADRLQTLDSAERARVLMAAAKAERRAQAIRAAMARKAAQDAASRYGE